MSKLSNLFSSISEGFRAARYNHTLSQLSDRQLADIGLNRSDISRRAMELAQRR